MIELFHDTYLALLLGSKQCAAILNDFPQLTTHIGTV